MISSLTEEAIREGFQQLQAGEKFDRLYAAGSARAIGDWLLGMNATRLYTLKYGQNKQVLSIGRVQTPTLAMIVNRQKEIEQFVPETYFEIKTIYRETTFSSSAGRFKNREEAASILQEIAQHELEITESNQEQPGGGATFVRPDLAAGGVQTANSTSARRNAADHSRCTRKS
jgi:DNA topoisomerase-3